MVGSFSPLAVAVCQAGGLGSLACAALGADALRAQIADIRAHTGAPFNVNFFSHVAPRRTRPRRRAGAKPWRRTTPRPGWTCRPPAAGRAAPFDEAMCEVVEDTRPAVVSFHFGLPPEDLLERVRRSGAMILSSATTVAEARWLDARGVDAIIAQGAEAGGHRGMFLTDDIHAQPGLYALLPQVVDAVRVPVIAAGAIADGRGIAAAFALGASAVQIGTAYLLTPQAGRSEIHRQAVREARDDTTRLTNLYTGRRAPADPLHARAGR